MKDLIALSNSTDDQRCIVGERFVYHKRFYRLLDASNQCLEAGHLEAGGYPMTGDVRGDVGDFLWQKGFLHSPGQFRLIFNYLKPDFG